MKYDRPVWKIMHQCADAMPETLRYEDVRDWFFTYYPDVNEATIRAHLIGLTEGGRAKHVQFAHRSPVFRRVMRGQYSPIPKAERGEDPDAAQESPSRIKMATGNGRRAPDAPAEDTPGKVREPMDEDSVFDFPSAPGTADLRIERNMTVFDVILVGSLGDRVSVPAPAKEVFRDLEFQLSRADAEQSGRHWFVLSAEHGLIAPHEWMTPDARTLADMEPSYRAVWASWVVARLVSLVGPLDGLLIRVDAPGTFIGPLFADLQDAGAVVSSGHLEQPRTGRAERKSLDEPSAEVRPIREDSAIASYLADARHEIPAGELDALPEAAGLYAWRVDHVGARVLNRCLRLPIRPGVLFVGQAGDVVSRGNDAAVTLRGQLNAIQRHGQARESTFRMTLATVLRDHLRMSSLDDPRLTEWMVAHLSVVVWPVSEPMDLRQLERDVIVELDPPLNLNQVSAIEYRDRLSQLRSASG